MKAKILGSAQDGGVPHLRCSCDACQAAREDPNKQRYATALKVYDEEKGVNYLFDASPDIRFQLGDEFMDGIFISHGHLGHVTGLLYLGKESINSNMTDVYCSESAADFLKENYPYRLLVDRNNIVLNTFEENGHENLMGMKVDFVPVIHRYVPTDMHAFRIKTDDTNLFYMTDIDHWTDDAIKEVESADVAIIDGCFWSQEEIDRYERVPHPPIKESLEIFEDTDTDIIFTHINHTNPVLDPESEERKKVEEAGFRIAEEGMEIEL
ncbi:MAG: MBL fold metallo-hydrolase [Candidatus Nanohaloarchaeota archaeon QJJ-7]|nr:MBL fold metallo-hydrolase [Candidatus Nanohaloarchaeota archaeon QJJ-7]